MKFSCRLFFFAIFVQSVFSQDLIQNPGFESGTLLGWEEKAGGIKSALSTEAYAGSFCAAIEGRGKLEQTVEGLEPGTDYILTCYTKALGGARSNVGIMEFGRGKSSDVIRDTNYVKVELPFRTGLEATSGTLFFYNLSSSGTVYADDFTLVKDTLSAFQSSLPEAPDGLRWQKIEHLSDEFNEDALDGSKWLDYHPYWKGREPSHHLPDNVWVADGTLRLTNTSRVDDLSEVADPEKDVWVDAACVTSIERNVSYGYYETRIKESNISMTSAFWFQGKYSEIDVIENLGAPSNNNGHEQHMRMNTHYYPGGWDNDQKTPRDWRMPYPAAEDFHVYGVWWIDERHVNFYHNGTLTAEIELPGDYDEPMYMFFDTEVFVWEGLPKIENLKNPDRNTMYVDWVRSWELVKDETSVQSEEKSAPIQLNLLPNYPNPFNPSTQINYSVEKSGPVKLSIYDTSGRLIRILELGHKTKGEYTVNWNGRNEQGQTVASGLYFCHLEATGSNKTMKMTLMR